MGLFKKKSKKRDASSPGGGDVAAWSDMDSTLTLMPSRSGHLPALSQQLAEAQRKQFFEVDQFRTLRTRLFFPSSGRLPRSIAVTSPGVGEGKTFVASNLAISISQNVDNRRTLLIDCDIRLPSVHRFFGFEDGHPGLSEYLSEQEGKVSLSSLLLTPIEDRLSILPGGNPPFNPSELLSSRKMMDLLEEIQSRYDDRYVVMDLPSPRLVAESGLLARQFEGVIIVAGYGRTTKPQFGELIDILGTENVLGVVFNRFDTSMHSALYRMYLKFIRRR